MRDWIIINGRKKRYQHTRQGKKCKFFAFYKTIKAAWLSFKFSNEDRKEK